MRVLWRWLGVVLVSSLMASVVLAQSAAAPESTLASAHEYEQAVAAGLSAFRAREYLRARDLFERAHALRPSARTARALGLTAVEQGRYTLAQQELQMALADTRQPLTAAQHQELEQMLAWMRSALAVVNVRLEPPEAQLSLDGERIVAKTLVLEPGAHTLLAATDGYTSTTQQLDLVAGSNAGVEVVLERSQLSPHAVAHAPAAEAEPVFAAHPQRDAEPATPLLQRWWFWTAVGVVVIAGGSVAAVALSSQGTARPPAGMEVVALRVGR
jgi:tetratricopeptide (TPR) repeat protein